ncbi:MAG: hypothetical protein ACRDON_10605 [Gaiellaceae bacterium]
MLGLVTILSGSQIDDLESGVVVEAQIRVTADNLGIVAHRRVQEA